MKTGDYTHWLDAKAWIFVRSVSSTSMPPVPTALCSLLWLSSLLGSPRNCCKQATPANVVNSNSAHRWVGRPIRYHTFLLSGCPVERHIAELSEAMSESHMGHLSWFRLIIFRWATFNDREVDVIVDVNVFYSDQQARWVSADITSCELKVIHHRLNPSFRKYEYERREAGTPYFLGLQHV